MAGGEDSGLLIPGPKLCPHAQHPRSLSRLGEAQVAVPQEQVGLRREKGSGWNPQQFPAELLLWICYARV